MSTLDFYLELDADTELKISVEAREFNGMDNDPKTVSRAPSVRELMILAAKLRELDGAVKLTSRSTLDFGNAKTMP